MRARSSSAASSGAGISSRPPLDRQEQARLQLEQRRDQDEELGRGLEIEIARLLEVLDVGDDDLAQLDFGQVHALAEDDGHEEVERAREDVELKVEFGYRHGGQSSPAAGRRLRWRV